MEKKKNQLIKKLGLISVSALLILFLFWFRPPSVGMATLPYAEIAEEEPELKVEIVPPVEAESEEEVRIKAQITFEPVRKTKLKAEVEERSIKNCPETSTLIFYITNIGSAPAERLFVEASKTLNILNCKNCELKNIAARETVKLEIEACAEKSYNNAIGFYSLNAEKVEVFLK